MNKLTCLEFIKNKSELINCVTNLDLGVEHTFKECCDFCFEPNLSYDDSWAFKIDTVVDFLHDELNTGHWSEVPISTRQAFTAASFVKANIVVRHTTKDPKTVTEDALKCIDLGILLGAPISGNEDLLTKTASFLNSNLCKLGPVAEQPKVKRKRAEANVEEYLNLKATEIHELKCPSLETFNKNHYLPQIPVKLKDCITHWPANTKWADLTYLLQVAGSRTVPIELGSHYTESNWSQKLMSLSDFIKDYYLGKTESIGYLAQHNLFDQISELKNDICIPEYCALSRNYEASEPPDINAWFGPKGTLSPLHYDPKDNLLAQVFGTKQVVLFAPEDSENLYPHEDMLLFNTAQIDPLKPDLMKFPKFVKAVPYKCLLEEGEVLYMPPKWWHHVTALDKSFSVSFWWQ